VTVARPLWVLEAGGHRAAFDLEHGGRLASLVVAGHELLPTEGTDIYHWGTFVLAPWVGRMRDGRFSYDGREYRFPLTAPPNAIHGLVLDVPWQVVGPDRLGVDLREPWPWRGRLVQAVSLASDRLDWRLELHAEEPMPAAIGWHPWFLRHLAAPDGSSIGPLELQFTPGRMYERGADNLPTGKLVTPKRPPCDDCFIDLARPPRMRWMNAEGSGFEVTVESDCAYWVLYDQEPQAICVEPWTAPPDSFNLLTPHVVQPGKPLSASMTWRWRFL
jgi:aldose 1-epimerase